jgi:hypothetical protein
MGGSCTREKSIVYSVEQNSIISRKSSIKSKTETPRDKEQVSTRITLFIKYYIQIYLKKFPLLFFSFKRYQIGSIYIKESIST